MLAHTVNGTTYAGIRGRTTGAPQNHWFGPAGDPRGAGIGTPEVGPPCPPFPSARTHRQAAHSRLQRSQSFVSFGSVPFLQHL